MSNKLVLKKAPILNQEETREYRGSCTIHSVANGLNISYDLALMLLQRVKPNSDGTYEISRTLIPKNKFSNLVHFTRFLELFANQKLHTTDGKDLIYTRSGTPSYIVADELKGTHILIEAYHAKVLHEGHIVDTSDSTYNEVLASYRLYRSKYMPFLIDVCEKIGVSLTEHTQKQSLATYIRKFDMADYKANKAKQASEMQDINEFSKLAKEVGLNPALYGTKLEIDGDEYHVIKIVKRNRKYPVIARNNELRRSFKLSTSQVEGLVKK